MTTNLLTCCERLDESKYWHKCACPTATFSCESEELAAELCGYSEFANASAPPKKYRKSVYESVLSEPPKVSWNVGLSLSICPNLEYEYNDPTATYSYTDSRSIGVFDTTEELTTSGETKTVDVDTCQETTIQDVVTVTGGVQTRTPASAPSCDGNYQGAFCGTTDVDLDYGAEVTTVVPSDTVVETSTVTTETNYSFLNHGNEASTYEYTSARTDTETFLDDDPWVEISCGAETRSVINLPALPARYSTTTNTTTLSEEDTDQDAIDRATPTDGTSCSSRWETRNSQFDWIKRTSGYTIECDDLVIGVEYEITPIIRKRTAQDDGSGTWEDVTVTPTTFTATAKTETIDDAGNPIDLDSIQGWEYEITDVNIEKKA